jgi:hypothetical protein
MNFLVNTGLRRIDTSSFGVFNRIMEGRINSDILISGSSRAMVHYDPRIIEAATGVSVYNIGLNGSQTDMQLALLKTYLRHNRKPRVVIHNLDLFSFQVTHGGVYDPGQYLPYLGEPAIYEALARINPEIWKAKYLPLYGYAVEDMRFTWMKGVGGLLGWSPAEDRYQGFVPRHLRWTGEFDEFQNKNSEGVVFPIEPEGIEAMEELADLCRKSDIRLVLVYSPVYRGMRNLESNRDEIFAAFRNLAEDCNAMFWDYSDSPLCDRKDYFYNSQHLNASGAELFSKELASRLASEPSLVGKPPEQTAGLHTGQPGADVP